MLHTQVVLVCVRRADMWIHQIDRTTTVDRQEAGRAEVEVLSWGNGREGIYSTGRPKWIAEESGPAGTHTIRAGNASTRNVIEKTDGREERWLTVKLQVVFTLQNVVEDADATTNAPAAIPKWVQGETEAWREIVLVREVCSLGSAFVSRERQSDRCVGKSG